MVLQKTHNIATLLRKVAQWRVKSNKIVFTNGCFDLVHVGHLHTLSEAKKLGDKLIVALNSDASVKKLKGNLRPIIPQLERMELIAALEFVDAVILFEEETPLQLIKSIVPDVLVKGGDWELEKIVGNDIVRQNGGEVVAIPFKEGYSTTDLIHKILNP